MTKQLSKLTLSQQTLQNLTPDQHSNKGEVLVTNAPICPTCSLALGKRN